MKEIENKHALRLTRRHLRYFRIIFSTGKLNVKQNKALKEMRSFDLKDLLSVKPLKVRDSKEPNNVGEKMLEQDEVKKFFKLDETSSESNWGFTFQLSFVQRDF